MLAYFIDLESVDTTYVRQPDRVIHGSSIKRCHNGRSVMSPFPSTRHAVLTSHPAIILSYPVYNVSKLQMPIRRKLAVIFIFLLGGLVTVCGAVRLNFLIQGYSALKKPLFDDIDYAYAPPFYWSVIECNVGILSACLPTIRPMFEAVRIDDAFSRLLSIVTGSTRTSATSASERTSDNIRLSSMDGNESTSSRTQDLQKKSRRDVYETRGIFGAVVKKDTVTRTTSERDLIGSVSRNPGV